MNKIKKISFILGLLIFLGSFRYVFSADLENYEIECKKQILLEVNYMTDKYIGWLDSKTKVDSTVSKDVLTLVNGVEVKGPASSKPNPKVLGMLTELAVDFDLLCYNVRYQGSFLDKCNWNNYLEDIEEDFVDIESRIPVWDYCMDLTRVRLVDLKDFTAIELDRDAAEEKTKFVLKKYKHITETFENLVKDVTYLKYYITSMAEMVDCYAQSCVPSSF